MTTKIKPLTQRPAWKALATHSKKARELHLRDLFAKDAVPNFITAPLPYCFSI